MANKQFNNDDKYTMDVWHKSYTQQELFNYRQKLAKEANKQIKELRHNRSIVTNKLISNEQTGAYPVYVKGYLKSKGRSYFLESKKPRSLSWHGLRHEIDVLQAFLNAKTSSAEAYQKAELSRINKFIEKGIPREMAYDRRFYDFLSSATFEELKKKFPESGDIIELIQRNVTDKWNTNEIIDLFENWLKDENASLKSAQKRFTERNRLK